MQNHSTPMNIMSAADDPTNLSQLDGLIIKLGRSQEPIKWFQCRFNETHGFSLDKEQLTPLTSADKQSFVPDILDQIESPVLDNMTDVPLDHSENQQIQ